MTKAIPSTYKICKSLKDIYKLIKYIKHTRICSFDFETNGKPFQDKTAFPTCIGFSFQVGSAWVIPLGHFDSPFKKTYKKILRLLGREIFHNTDIIKIAQNIKFELKWLKRYGVNVHGIMNDTMVAHYLLDENSKHGLKEMVREMIAGFADYEEEVDILKKKHGGWEKIPLIPLAKYNALDCDLTLRLMMYFQTKLIKGGFYKLYRNIMMMGTKVLAESEFHGMPVDPDYLDATELKYRGKIEETENSVLNHPFIKKYEKRAKQAHVDKLISAVEKEINEIRKDKTKKNPQTLIANRQQKIRKYLSGEFTAKKEIYNGLNMASHVQMKDLFYESKKGFRFPKQYNRKKNAKTGIYEENLTTDEAAILRLKDLKVEDHGFLDKLLELRGLEKLHSTYMVGIQNEIAYDGKVHSSDHMLTVTGRLGCKEPNMQNVPRVTTNPDVKPMFKPQIGFLLYEADYGQAELRVVAELSGDKNMIEIFQKGINIHVGTACLNNGGMKMYEKAKGYLAKADELTGEELLLPENKIYLHWAKEKKKAKTINFGILYEQGDEKLAEGLGVPVPEAAKYKKSWLSNYPGVNRWIDGQHKLVRKQGFVTTIWGRKRRLPDIWDSNRGKAGEASRQSVNAPIQSTSNDFTVFTTIIARKERLEGKLPNYLIQYYTVHDSIGYPVKPTDINKVVPAITKIGENPNTLKYFGFEFKKVRMKLRAQIGHTWGNLKDYNPWNNYKKILEEKDATINY